MKISTRGRYGLRAMVDIASQGDGQCVNIKSIAERQGISEHYLEQLFSPLKKCGYIKSIRGAQGGYVLNIDPDSISVGDILRVMEGSLFVTDCMDTNNDNSVCGRDDNCKTCVTKSVWEKIQNSVDEIINGIKLSELVNDYKLLNLIDS